MSSGVDELLPVKQTVLSEEQQIEQDLRSAKLGGAQIGSR